jgi:CubicO group peptidase (beta-lactamase class C family)
VQRRTFLGALSGLAAAACGSSKNDPAPGADAAVSLDDYVRAQLELAHLPGLGAAVVRGGRVAWVGSYGFANLETKTAVARDTVFFLASISKTVTSTTLMTLVEAGLVKLDDDVNGYLSFAVRNPKWPDVPITIRHLLTHSSSIQETSTRLVSLAKPGDPTTSLQQLLEPYLVPGGATYVAGESYGPQKPGTTFVYSNFAVALVGLIIERVTSKPFAEACKRAVFTPLGLVSTSFLLADLDSSKIAVPYTWISGKGQIANPQTSVPYLPATALRTTAAELARFLACITNKGEIDGTRILTAASVAEMTKIQMHAGDPQNGIDDEGLLWEHRVIAGAPVIGHGGSYYGSSTSMHYRERDGLGVLVLANGDVHLRISLSKEEESAAFAAIEERLYAEGDRLTT